MRNYFYISKERTNSIYNQLRDETPVKKIVKNMSTQGISKDWDAKIGGGYNGFISANVGFKKSKNEEKTFEESVHLNLELEQKIAEIERKIPFTDINMLLPVKNNSIVGSPVSFKGGYYSRGLKLPQDYAQGKWDGTLPVLFARIKGFQVKVVYSPAHFLSQSPWSNVHGRVSIDGIGFVDKQEDETIIISPIAFGGLIKPAAEWFYENF